MRIAFGVTSKQTQHIFIPQTIKTSNDMDNNVNLDLMSFIETEILPRYSKFDKAHNLSHVTGVVKRSITLAKSIVCSNLTKAAIAGHDANWGRILCAMGYSGAKFDPDKVDLYFESAAGKIQLIENGVALDYSEEKATEILSQPEVTVIADIKEGDVEAAAWGCDLTHEYININADYRS